MVSFGVQLYTDDFEYEALCRACREIEEMGFKSVWVYDHLIPPIQPANRPVLESWTTLSALASETSRLRLGSMMTCNTFRHPSVLAKIATTVDVISSGRLEFGIGTGWCEEEHRSYGIPFPKHSVRIEQLKESLQVIRKLWTEKETSFQGKYYKIEDAICYPKPIQKPHPPIWVGGTGDKILREVIAPYADVCNIDFTSPEVFRQKMEALEKYCSEIGRNFHEIRKSWFGVVTVLKDGRRAREEVEHVKSQWAVKRFQEMSFEEYFDRAFAGTPEQCIEKIGKYVEAGATYLVMHFTEDANLNSARRFAETVIPAFS